MFGTIRKHQKWLWAVIITLTIVSFVIYFGPQTRVDSSIRSRNHGAIDGRKISDQDYVDAWREVYLRHFVLSGRWPDEDKRSGFDPEPETYDWLLVIQKQRELGIEVGPEATQRVARELLSNLERARITTPQMFFEKVLPARGFRAEDFERFVRHYLGIQELINTVGLSGRLIPPDQAKSLYERDHRELATEAVFFWSSNYVDRVQVPPEALAQFYSNQLANYRIPERVQVAYVHFNLTNFLPQAQGEVTNLNEIVEANYLQLGTNLTPAEAKAKLRDQVLRQQALYLAAQKAAAFDNVLSDTLSSKPEDKKQAGQATAQAVETLKQLAASNNLPVQVSAPFDRDSSPKGLEVGPEFSQAAFKLTPDEPYSVPLRGQDGVYVIALDKTIPSEVPRLDQIRDRVTADFKHSQAMRMAQQDATGFASTVTNRMAEGKTFTNICAELNVKPVSLPPFSISTRSLKEVEDFLPLSQLKQGAFGTAPGKLAPVLPTSEGSIVLYVAGKLPLDTAREQTELPNYIAQLRRTRQQETFNEWFARQRQTGLRDTPVGRPKAPEMGTKTASAS